MKHLTITVIDENEKNDVNFCSELESYLAKYYKVSEIPKEFGMIVRDSNERDKMVREMNLGGSRYDSSGKENSEFKGNFFGLWGLL